MIHSFENYIRNLFNYRISLKKFQYQLWDDEKIEGKIQNHIIVFGFNAGCIHFIRAIRKKCELPIVFFDNNDIQLDIFKANNLFGNIFHFWGDAFDKKHLEKACIQDAYAVVILAEAKPDHKVVDDGQQIKIVRMIEQFYKIDRIIIEMLDHKKISMLGYEPKDIET